MTKPTVAVVATGILGVIGILIHHRIDASKSSAGGEFASERAIADSPHSQHVNSDIPEAEGDFVAQEVPEAADNTESYYRSRLQASRDLWQFAEDILPAAKSGDPAAQYYLHRALAYCDTEYRFYFIRGARRRTLDEAMQWASTRIGLEAEEAREIHEKCSRLQEGVNPFGTAEEWLSVARENDYELAMVDSALRLATKAGVSGAAENAEMRDEAKRLALKALESRNPEVIFSMGDLSMLFLGDMEKASKVQWAWRLAACKRGYECGQQANWYEHMCRFDPNCQPYESGVDLIRRMNSEDFDDIDRLATELNDRLDAGDFSWFGL